MILVLLFAIAQGPDEVPLIFPTFEVTPRERPRAETRELRSSRAFHLRSEARFGDSLLHVGGKLTGLMQSGALSGGTAIGAEIGLRPKIWQRRLGLMFEPRLAGLWGGSRRGNSATVALTLGFAATYHQELGPGLIRAMVGPEISWLSIYTQGPAEDLQDRYWTVGGAMGGGYLWSLGPGAVSFELRYHILTSVVAQTRSVGHGVTLGVGYVMFL